MPEKRQGSGPNTEPRQSGESRKALSPSPSGRGQGEGNRHTLTPAPLPRWGEGKLAEARHRGLEGSSDTLSAQTATWSWLGRIPYEPALHLQEQIRDSILTGTGRDTLLLLEHPPVITLGRNAQAANVLLSPARLDEYGIALCRTSRGGDVTFHGPGQLVGYPVFRLRRGVRAHIEAMANTIVEWLAAFGISAQWRSQTPGVWIGQDKICAFGIHVRHRIAIHGFALNLSTDMSGFRAIVPCGLREAGVTSLSQLLGQSPTPEAAGRDLIGLFEKHFGVQLVESACSFASVHERRESPAKTEVS